MGKKLAPIEEIVVINGVKTVRRRCPYDGTVLVLGVIPDTEIPAWVCPKCGYFIAA